MPCMQRLRALAAVLGCLAVLAGGLMTVAAAAPLRVAAEAPCPHCDDCDAMPCPVPAATCQQPCTGGTPSLAAIAVAPPTGSTGETLRAARPDRLAGLSPPPDPFPPRI